MHISAKILQNDAKLSKTIRTLMKMTFEPFLVTLHGKKLCAAWWGVWGPCFAGLLALLTKQMKRKRNKRKAKGEEKRVSSSVIQLLVHIVISRGGLRFLCKLSSRIPIFVCHHGLGLISHLWSDILALWTWCTSHITLPSLYTKVQTSNPELQASCEFPGVS